MGIFGAGNSGAAVTKFVAPALLVAFGWAMVPKVYAVAMLVTALLFWALSPHDPAHRVGRHVTVQRAAAGAEGPEGLEVLRSTTRSSSAATSALSLWMTKYYVTEYGIDIRIAALLAACFSLPGGVLRAIGGWISDKYGAHPVTWWVMLFSWVCLFFLSYPQTELVIKTAKGDYDMHVGLNVWTFTVLMFVMGMAWAIGKASVFKYISDDYSHNIGVVSGIVGLVGGLGGFLLPIMFGALVDLTGVNSTIFMLMWGVTLGVADLDVLDRDRAAARGAGARRPRWRCSARNAERRKGARDVH